MTVRILLIDQHFWPDMPGYFTWAIGRQLVRDGHDVTVLTMQPSYNSNRGELRRPTREQVDGMAVVRLPTLMRKGRTTLAKLLSGLALSSAAFWSVLRGRHEVVRFGTTPPVMLGLAVVVGNRLSSTPSRLVYHCQDLFPEVLRPAPGAPRPRWFGLLRRLDIAVSRACSAVVVLSTDMAETVVARGIGPDRVVVINNPSIVHSTDAAIPDGYLPDAIGRAPLVLFAGNLGRFQQLHQLVDAAHLLAHEPLHICLMGEGPIKAELRRRAGALDGRTVHFLPFVPPEVAFGVLKRADLAVVSLAPGVHRAAYPSKTTTALMAGCRLLVMAEPESELVRTTIAHDLGSWGPQDDPAGLADVLRRETRALRPGEHRRVESVAGPLYSQGAILPQWTALFERLSGTRCTQPPSRVGQAA